MSKPSFTKDEQIKHLVELWGMTDTQVKTMLRDVRSMDKAALSRGDRVYWDDFGTLHVEIKKPVYKRLPGSGTPTLFGARVNVKFQESKDLISLLSEAFEDELALADQSFEF